VTLYFYVYVHLLLICVDTVAQIVCDNDLCRHSGPVCIVIMTCVDTVAQIVCDNDLCRQWPRLCVIMIYVDTVAQFV